MTTSKRLSGQVAIVGVGFSELSRNSGKSVGALALHAAKNAILDAGLKSGDIDGIGGVHGLDQATVGPPYIAEGLGIPRATWCYAGPPPSLLGAIEGAHAVFAGTCRYALIVHAKYKWDHTSSSAVNDPLRKAPFAGGWDPHFSRQYQRPCGRVMGMTAQMARHMHEYGSERRHYGMIAVNNRTNAALNPRAVFKAPITLDDYLNSRMVVEPFCLLDMDMPIDGAMAVVLTLQENARDHPHRPVLIDAASMATTAFNDLSGNHRLEYMMGAPKIVGEELWGVSGLKPEDIDLTNIYDGFSMLTMLWIEGVLVGKGNGAAFLEESWVEEEQRLRFWGRVPMSTHGGNLSEGRVQGFGHLAEAVLQLRGQAGPRQVPDARLALVTNGVNGTNGGMLLRAD